MREVLIPNNKNKHSNNHFENKKTLRENNNRHNNRSIYDIIKSSSKSISLELCPNRQLNWKLLAEMRPDFCSVTWLGSVVDNLKPGVQVPAIKLAEELCSKGYEVILHLAGRNLYNLSAINVLKAVEQAGIRNLFLVQGDQSLAFHCNDKIDFPYAHRLVEFVKSHYVNYFCIGVASYPEKHPQSPTKYMDIKYLKKKVLSGADFIITQASFDYKAFQEFSKTCNQRGIDVPIIAGIFIISSYTSFKSMVKFCEIPVPDHVMNVMEMHRNNEKTLEEYGVYLAITLMRQILNDPAFSGIHVFTLNNLEIVKPVLKALGVYNIKIERPL